jgi:hypothetical protein
MHRFPEKTLCAAIAADGKTIGTGTAKSMCYITELPPRVAGDR